MPPSDKLAVEGSMVGERIGKYVITRELARGGMGVVYEAVHDTIGHRAAVKVLSAELSQDGAPSQYVGRFLDEARAVNVVAHPGIVKIFDFGTTRGETAYIMMEFLEGENLYDRFLRLGRRVPMWDALRITRQIASAMAAAHQKRIIHRDLKPENVILIADPDIPEEERTKVVDFGIARFMDATYRRTATGLVMGTPIYISPEQCAGEPKVDGKVDVYALGIMVYEMLVGKPPFEGEAGAVMKAHLNTEPAPLQGRVSGLPPEVHRLVHEMMAKDAAGRPPMDQIVARIKTIEAERGAAPQVAEMPPTAALATVDMAAGRYAKTQMVAAVQAKAVTNQLTRPTLTRGRLMGAAGGLAALALALTAYLVFRPKEPALVPLPPLPGPMAVKVPPPPPPKTMTPKTANDPLKDEARTDPGDPADDAKQAHGKKRLTHATKHRPTP